MFGDSNSTTLRRIKQDRIGLSLSRDSASSPVNLKFATYDEKSLEAGRLAGVQLLLLRSLCFAFKSFLLFLFFCSFIRNSLFFLQILTILGLLRFLFFSNLRFCDMFCFNYRYVTLRFVRFISFYFII